MNDTVELMLELVRCSLSGAVPALPPMGEAEWKSVFGLARRHGVVTIAHDAIVRLPDEQQPQGDIALSWALSADRTREIFAQQSAALAHIRARASAAGLRAVVLKGMSLARLYPNPSSRACGDIDLYFPGAYTEANRLLAGGDAPLVGKHSEFVVEGVTVENHLHFLDLNYRSQRRAETLIASAVDSGTAEELPPIAGMVFLLMHTVCHITATDKLALRNVLDWGLYLHSRRSSLPPSACRQAVRHVGMEEAFNLLTRLAEDFAGLDLNCYHTCRVRKDDAVRMRQLILGKDYLEHVPQGLPFLQTVKIKVSRYRRRRWIYRYLPASPCERRRATLHQLLRLSRQHN